MRKVLIANQFAPVLGLGTWQLGRCADQRNQEIEAIRVGIELGMGTLDTAEMYGNEDLVGEAIADCRKAVYLISKVLPSNASYRGTLQACERSLNRLGVETIDLYLLHWAGSYPIEETIEAFEELKARGRIKAWGVSNFDLSAMQELCSKPKGQHCAANELHYNLGFRAIDFQLKSWCQKQQMPVIAYSPLGEGALVQHPLLVEIGRQHHVSAAQIALSWVLSQPGLLAIPKAGSLKHIRENAMAEQIKLTKDDLKRLEKAFPAPTYHQKITTW